jgi:acyl-CoA synthetase (AMP-forming)/AMP-acid ligase II
MPKGMILRELSRYPVGTWADIIYRNALLYSNEEILVYGTERITCSRYNADVNRLIHAMQAAGMKKGDGIGVLSWNGPEYVAVYGAAMKGGFIISPLNPRLKEDELEYLINYSEIKTLAFSEEFAEVASRLRPRLPAVENFVSLAPNDLGFTVYGELLASFPDDEPDVCVREEDPFVIFYTSGTTGVPRGALYTHRSNIDHTRTRIIQAGIERGNKHIMILPLFHIGGYSHFWPFFYLGSPNIILPQRSFDPAATLLAIQDEKATDIHIVPTHLVSMLALPDVERYNLRSLKCIWYAASPMPEDLLRRGIERFGPIFGQGYGQSEAGPDITILPKADHDVLDKPAEEQKSLRSCGQPCLGVHVRIVDPDEQDVMPYVTGEIVVQSKTLMLEYWRRPKETQEAMAGGWLHTGDMGHYDEQGYIFIVGRKKDMIITGGENVYPREIEEVLHRHPAVLECAVIGVPDDVWIERVHAVVVPEAGAGATGSEIMEFCRRYLASYKAPKSIEFVASHPKNPQGKILKTELRKRYGA